VAAYQVGAESGLLVKDVLSVAVAFQGHHKEHAAAIAATVHKLGGQAVAAKTRYSFPVDKLKTQADVLRFAALEGCDLGLRAQCAVCRQALAQVAAGILGDGHTGPCCVRSGENPVPSAFMS
jgi:hypothetical protein